MIEAFPDDTAPRWLLRDRDAMYGDAFRRRVAGIGIGEVISSRSSPWQNPYAERLIGAAGSGESLSAFPADMKYLRILRAVDLEK
jgi:hypothetical protein